MLDDDCEEYFICSNGLKIAGPFDTYKEADDCRYKNGLDISNHPIMKDKNDMMIKGGKFYAMDANGKIQGGPFDQYSHAEAAIEDQTTRTGTKYHVIRVLATAEPPQQPKTTIIKHVTNSHI